MKLNRSIEINPSRSCTKILEAICQNGYEAYIVGGCVRDAIIGRPVNDYDITTNARPKDVRKIAEKLGARTYDIGIKHGTISVNFLEYEDEAPVEVTTYRSDGNYSDGRHPDSVSFVGTLDEDLRRRDFTMNAICYSPHLGIYDPFDGIDDIKSKTVRAIGNPKKRFSEDALRIMRAARFASQLGFEIDDTTLLAAKMCKSKLLQVASERIAKELELMLAGEFVHDAIMNTHKIIDCAIPEITACAGFNQHTKYHAYDVLEHIAYVTQYVKNTRTLRFAAFLHDIGKPATFFQDENGQGHFYGHAEVSRMLAEIIVRRLRIDKKTSKKVLTLIERHNDTLSPTEKSINKTIRLMDGNVELFRDLLELKRADSLGHAPNYQDQVHIYDEIEKLLDNMISEGAIFSEDELAIDGNDILNIGLAKGSDIKKFKTFAFASVMNKQVKNEKDELIQFLKSHAKEINKSN